MLTDVQKTLIWCAARGLGADLSGGAVVEIANRESDLRGRLAQCEARIDQLISENDVLRSIMAAHECPTPTAGADAGGGQEGGRDVER